MTNTVFKVVHIARFHPKVYVSVAGYYRPNERLGDDIVLEYKIGEVTKPKIKGSAIYAFDNSRNAIEFISRSIGFNRHDAEIFECECAVDENAPPVTDGQIWHDNIVHLWKMILQQPIHARRSFMPVTLTYHDYLNKIAYINVNPAPKGTIMCKWVKPIGIAT